MTLRAEDIEAIASRVIERLNEARRRPSAEELSGGLVDAATVARLLGVSRATVYANANQLGAIRLGKGKRARLRFDPARLAGTGALAGSVPHSAEPSVRRHRAANRSQSAEHLLPIRGSASGAKGRRRRAQPPS